MQLIRFLGRGMPLVRPPGKNSEDENDSNLHKK